MMVQRPSRALAFALALGACAAALALPTAADHAQAAGGRLVSFDHRTGNAWWVEVIVGGPDAASVAAVEAQDTGGPWTALERKSWGAYAASFHIEPGHQVRFRATWPGGDEATSCWFSHPAGAEACPSEPSSSPSTTSTSPSSAPAGASFDHRGGNEWWVEAIVTGAAPTRVQAQDTGGPWTGLQLRSWGAWAGSFHIEPGHQVRFRAEVGGSWQESCWFTHPQGLTPTGGATCGAASSTTTSSTTSASVTTSTTTTTSTPPGDGFASFSGVKGNPWWVEVRVASDRPLAAVHARVDDGPWRALSLRDWGAWAASFQIHDGAYVDFRATASDGATALSQDYVWPTVRPVTAWPQAGSFVTYRLHSAGGAPDGSWSQDTTATLRLAYDGSAWAGRCVGRTTTTDYTGASSTSSFDVAVQGSPATAPRDATQGTTFDPDLLESAGLAQCRHGEDAIVAEDFGPHQTSLRDSPGGRQVTLQTWLGGETADASAYESNLLVWETRLGLALDWSHSARGGGLNGHLIDTDAPIR